MKKVFLSITIFLLIFCSTKQCDTKEQKSPFLITKKTKKRMSKNRLKENIGQKLKKSLYECTSIANELGSVQRELAILQRRLLSRVEGLVENQKSFKKAKRSELNDALQIISKVKSKLKNQRKEISQITLEMNKNRCL